MKSDRLVCCAFMTSVSEPMDPLALCRFWELGRDFHGRVGVTGVSLHHEGVFLHYVEGRVSGVEAARHRIESAEDHHQFIELLSEPVSRRLFAEWTVGCADFSASPPLETAHTVWQDELQRIGQGLQWAQRTAEKAGRRHHLPDAWLLLSQFWQRHTEPVRRLSGAVPVLA